MSEPPRRFRIVPHRALPSRGWVLGIAVVWLLSLAAAWGLATWRAVPSLGQMHGQLRAADRDAARQQERLAELNQRLVTLQRSDQISRAANGELQSSLAERDEEIAALRADVAFYERLVGATTHRKGLSVHSVEFTQEEAGTGRAWPLLTSMLGGAALRQGPMRLPGEGLRGGKCASIGWNELQQREDTPGKAYSFRFFQ